MKNNICLWHELSPIFLKEWKEQDLFGKNPIIYLDAHFYDKSLPKNKRFVVVDELKALEEMKRCIIIIHDFDNNLGHITYDGIPLDMKLVKPFLLKVNPKFYFYTNTLAGCNIIKNSYELENENLHGYIEVLDNLKYVWSKPEKTYRGILYCLPFKLTNKEIFNLGLRKWN